MNELASSAASAATALRTVADLLDRISPQTITGPTQRPDDCCGLLSQFLSEQTYSAPGHSVFIRDLYESFGGWCHTNGYAPPTKLQMIAAIPADIVLGFAETTYKAIGNRSLTPIADDPERSPLIVVGGRLRPAFGSRRRRRAS